MIHITHPIYTSQDFPDLENKLKNDGVEIDGNILETYKQHMLNMTRATNQKDKDKKHLQKCEQDLSVREKVIKLYTDNIEETMHQLIDNIVKKYPVNIDKSKEEEKKTKIINKFWKFVLFRAKRNLYINEDMIDSKLFEYTKDQIMKLNQKTPKTTRMPKFNKIMKELVKPHNKQDDETKEKKIQQNNRMFQNQIVQYKISRRSAVFKYGICTWCNSSTGWCTILSETGVIENGTCLSIIDDPEIKKRCYHVQQLLEQDEETE